MPRTTRLVYLMCGFSSSDMTNDCQCQSGKKKAHNSKQVAEDAADSLYEPEQWTRYQSVIRVLNLSTSIARRSHLHIFVYLDSAYLPKSILEILSLYNDDS